MFVEVVWIILVVIAMLTELVLSLIFLTDDTVGIIENAKDLFKGYPSLLLGLNPFLTMGYEIVLNDEDGKIYLMEQALDFVKKNRGYPTSQRPSRFARKVQQILLGRFSNC
ncbi:hypothetical protein MTR67_043537 [Solanum verrucosum]|uniref:Uncharacterized protein n=1 Tax=Solanum verrucosum TaxID=315347 RepID=A0AAF0UPK9_SOLVR|nr:hypothetical protein MTR67_043537 [Solanum verrucosum]